MPKKRAQKPEFYQTFMEGGFFPNANKITKFQDSENYWIFKTGEKVYKVKKEEGGSSAVPLEEIFCHETVKQLQKHSPALNATFFTVKKENETYLIDGDGSVSSAPIFYGISMNQLPDRGFLSNIISKNKLTENLLDRIIQQLHQFHLDADISKSKDDGSPDLLSSKIQNLYYQSKKYLNVTINQAIIDMTLRPLEKYLLDNRKLFLKRMKKGSIRLVHGCFIPRKIHITNEGINFLGRTSDPIKNQFNDIASDLADLSVMLNHADQQEMANYLIESYSGLSGDRETGQVVPIYQAMKCLELGLINSIKSNQSDKQLSQELKTLAIAYYEQTIDVVRCL